MEERDHVSSMFMIISEQRSECFMVREFIWDYGTGK